MSENRLRFEDFDFLLNINKLNISANELSAPDIRPNTLPSLQVLDLSFNGLLPDQVKKLKSFGRLKDLALVGNKLDHLPEELVALQSLEVLNISYNLFSSNNTQTCDRLWRNLANLRQLKSLTLTGNQLKGIHTTELVPGDFASLEQLDFRHNWVDDQLRLICARNFMSLKKLFVTGNEFCSQPYDYLREELDKRVGAEVAQFDQIINETVSYKLQQDLIKKKPIPIIFENFVVIKNDEFRRKMNTEFFGVDIPLQEQDLKKQDDRMMSDREEDEGPNQTDVNNDNFFLTGVLWCYLRQEFRPT